MEHAGLASAIEALDSDQILLCIDASVMELYPELVQSVKKLSKVSGIYETKPGESTKTFREFEKAHEYFLNLGVYRGAHLIAIGGGACSDFGGFIASSLLRGISWSVVPTTLLSMVDAAIGGKTAINSSNGKNLVGAFHLPDQVWIDSHFLKTLESSHYQSGLGEIIKYALLNQDVLDAILSKQPLNQILRLCAQHKQDLVEIDFKELGERKSLNLGHTIGHALEVLLKVPHGIAVFWGLVLEHRMFGFHDLASKCLQLAQELGVDIQNYPIPKNFDTDLMYSKMAKDKKLSSKSSLTFAVCEKIGHCSYPSVELKDLKKKIESLFQH